MTNIAAVIDRDNEPARYGTIRHGTIRWWEPLLGIPVVVCLGWLIVLFGLAFTGGFLLAAIGYRTEVAAFAANASTNFYGIEISIALFYLVALLALRQVLRNHRGSAWFADYFRPIGIVPVLYGMLGGLALTGVYVLAIAGFSLTSLWDFDPTSVEIALRPQSLGELALTGLVTVVLAPFTEEIYFRGLLLDWCRQALAPLPAALITAAMFSVVHLQFLHHPGFPGWLATGAIAGLGVINALWVQRTGSLRAPVAAHAAYNATLILIAFLVR